MKNILNWTCRLRLRKVVRSLAFGIALAMAVTGVAHADDHRGGKGGGHGQAGSREWRQHESRGRGYAQTGYIYAPPPVVYYPQYESPGLNLIFPLHIN